MICRRVLMFLISFVVTSVTAMTLDLEKYLASLPEGPVIFKREHTYWSVSYCPDNTCDLMQISTSVKEEEVRRLGLGFFIYFSGYIYLNQWQDEARRNEEVQTELQLLSTAACQLRYRRQLVECRFRELASRGKLKVFAVRFDEGKKRRIRLRLSDVLR